ncbi:MAG: patatin-like phospholipase family protein [Vicinamibacteria bacterium]
MKEHTGHRTAVVFAGSGASGAYHAGVLKALDEAGVRIDVMVGSGVGVLAAAFGAAASGPALYGEKGFWREVTSRRIFRLRAGFRFLRSLGLVAMSAFVVPALLALLLGLLLPAFLAVDFARPGFMAATSQTLVELAPGLRLFFVFALAAPTFVAFLFVLLRGGTIIKTSKRRYSETLESAFDLSDVEADLSRRLWEVARGPALNQRPPATSEVGRQYSALIAENAGQPGFRGLVLRAANLDARGPLVLKLVGDGRNDGSRMSGGDELLDLKEPAAAPLLYDVVATAFAASPFLAPRRVRLPKQGAFGGEVHRIAEASAVPGAGLSEAIALGASQIVFVTATAHDAGPMAERRGFKALAGAFLALQERTVIDNDLRQTERINRMVETVGHQDSTGEREWQDPLTGRRFRTVTIHVVRPRRALLRPLDLDGALDPTNEVETTLMDWLEEGHRDAHRCYLDSALGEDRVRGGSAPKTPTADLAL